MNKKMAIMAAVIDLSRKFHEYKVARNLTGLNEILTPDFVLVHMTGYQQPREEWLSQVEDEQMKYYSSTEEHISYKVNGNRAIVVTQNRVDARIYGYRNTWPLQLTFTMVKENGTWMIQHADATTY